MTGDEAAFLTRPDLPDGFERWTVDLPGRMTRPTAPDEWAGALVRIESGTLEVGCEAGGTETFHAGDMLAPGWLPLVELRNDGDEPVRIVAVRRREGRRPTHPYLRVTHPDA
jgi:hypothetical protein